MYLVGKEYIGDKIKRYIFIANRGIMSLSEAAGPELYLTESDPRLSYTLSKNSLPINFFSFLLVREERC